MIISKTPLRISFFSGGSDMSSFYQKSSGAAFSATIDKYIYVMTHNVPHSGFRNIYDSIEIVDEIDKMRHDITRETFKEYVTSEKYTTASISDVLARGTGLGSSSAFTVGLINTMIYENENRKKTPIKYSEILASAACKIEIDRCQYPIGKQDQYAAAYGGFNYLKFHSDESVTVIKPKITSETIQKLNENLLLVYSGVGRSANEILKNQKAAMLQEDKFNLVANGRDKAIKAVDFIERGDVDSFGNLLDMAWHDKKRVTKEISNDYFDGIYETAIMSGAIGGKLLGAGGGGFFIFYVPVSDREKLAQNILKKSPSCKIYDFNFVGTGSEIIYFDK